MPITTHTHTHRERERERENARAQKTATDENIKNFSGILQSTATIENPKWLYDSAASEEFFAYLQQMPQRERERVSLIYWQMQTFFFSLSLSLSGLLSVRRISRPKPFSARGSYKAWLQSGTHTHTLSPPVVWLISNRQSFFFFPFRYRIIAGWFSLGFLPDKLPCGSPRKHPSCADVQQMTNTKPVFLALQRQPVNPHQEADPNHERRIVCVIVAHVNKLTDNDNGMWSSSLGTSWSPNKTLLSPAMPKWLNIFRTSSAIRSANNNRHINLSS